jgi:hypothetical protein
MFFAPMTYGARYRCKESGHQWIEDPAGVAGFAIALFCL